MEPARGLGMQAAVVPAERRGSFLTRSLVPEQFTQMAAISVSLPTGVLICLEQVAMVVSVSIASIINSPALFQVLNSPKAFNQSLFQP